MMTMSSAVDRRPRVPHHAIGWASIGPVRRLWCACGWRWSQDDPQLPLDAARRLAAAAEAEHLAGAQAAA